MPDGASEGTIDLRHKEIVDELLGSGRLTIHETLSQPPTVSRRALP